VPPDALASLYRHIRAMHGLGIYHGALSWKNVLLAPGADGRPLCHLADFSRALRFPGDLFGTGMARVDLEHLTQQLLPREGEDACAEFLEAYGLDARASGRVVEAARDQSSRRRSWNRQHWWFIARAIVQGRGRRHTAP
jgi:tRNA A-37 threonylcarbamoyl transferase component Bud32